MNICTTCKRELKVGQRIQPNYKLVEAVPGKGVEHMLGATEYQHSNCLDADGPRYDGFGNEIDERTGIGYIKPAKEVMDDAKDLDFSDLV